MPRSAPDAGLQRRELALCRGVTAAAAAGLAAGAGTFRRIPVLQRGADFFCDTRLMAEVLDSVTPVPPLFPPEARALSALIANWAEPRAFVMMGPVRFETREDVQPLLEVGIQPGDFLRDRAPFMAPAVDTRRSAAVACQRARPRGRVPHGARRVAARCRWFAPVRRQAVGR